MAAGKETREGVALSSLDDAIFPDAGVTKRQLIDYLDGVRTRILPVLHDRPLSVIRTTGDEPFMQKNLPKYTPDWVKRVDIWAEASHRSVSYGLCNDRPTLLWFANQRAVEYHPTLSTADHLDRATELVLDLDPPAGDDVDGGFRLAVQAAHLVRQALGDVGLSGAVKTSGAKGVHVVVPIERRYEADETAAVTRAVAQRAAALDPDLATTAFLKADRGNKVFVDATRAGGATVIAAYSPRARAGVPVSYPVGWEHVDQASPRDFTILTALDLLGDDDPWAAALPAPQRLSADLIAEGQEIPIPRVAAMHEGKRRKRAAAGSDD